MEASFFLRAEDIYFIICLENDPEVDDPINRPTYFNSYNNPKTSYPEFLK